MNSYSIEEYQGYMEKPVSSGALFLTLIMVLYVALVGPVVYLVLKALKMREKIWLAIPALSLIFVFFIFLISLGVRVRGVSLKSVSAVNVVNNKRSNFYLGYAPDPEEWSILTNSEHDYGDFVTAYSYSEDVDASIRKSGNGEKVTFYPNSSFDTQCAVLYNREEYNADFDWDLNLPGSTYDEDADDYDYDPLDYIHSGTVVNNTGVDFDYILMISPGGCQLEENVKDGDKIIINLDSSSSSGYGYYSNNKNDLINKYVVPLYKNNDYKKSGAIASMLMTIESEDGFSRDFVIVGVRENKSMTNENENSWECFYKLY
jgi:hypothetical protein